MYALYNKLRWYVGIALLLCVGMTVMKYSAWIDRKLFGTSKQSSSVAQQPGQSGNQLPSPVSQSATSGQAANAPLAPANVFTQLTQAKTLLNEAATNASEALEATLTWETDVEARRDQVFAEPKATAAGAERLADDETSKRFDQLAFLMRKERTSPQELRDARGRIESLQLKVDDLMEQPSPVALSPIDMAEISQLHATGKQAKEEWRTDVDAALACMYSIDKQTERSTKPVAPATIGTKIQEADTRKTLEDLEAEIERSEQEEAARLAADRERERLIAKAHDPAVRAKYSPFLAEGKWIFGGRKRDEYDFPRPASYTKIVNSGALKDLDKFIESGAGPKDPRFASPWRYNDRPRWTRPGNQAELDRYRDLFEEFKELAPIWAKLGYLQQ